MGPRQPTRDPARRQGIRTLFALDRAVDTRCMAHFSDVIDELREPTRDLRRAQPEVWKGFGALHDAAVTDGALSGRVKELIALAIAVVKQCDGCIAYHAKSAAGLG